MEIIIKLAQFIVSLGLLIVLHEGGHFLFAKLFKTRVEKFYLFFDYKFHLFSTYDNWFRRLIGKKPVPKDGKGEHQYNGTEYGIGWIPFGGYVKIAGMIDESMDKEQMKQPPKAWEFRTKPAWQRLLIMLGGVILNFIVAFVIYAMVLFAWGEDYIKSTDMTNGMKFSAQAKEDGFQDGDIILGADDEEFLYWTPARARTLTNSKVAHVLRNGERVDIALPSDMNLLEMLEAPQYATELLPLHIDSILPESPAAKAGIQAGNLITAINGTPINDFNDIQYTLLALSEQLTKESTAHDSLVCRTITLDITDGDSVRHAQAVLTKDFTLGFINQIPNYTVTHHDYGFFESFPAGVVYGWKILKGYVSDLKYIFTKKGARSVGGFIAIASIFPATWEWHSFWMLTAFLSIILGFMNVLPIPALDGGHAIFAIYEIITHRQPSEKLLERVQYVGMFLLIALLLFANLNDVLRLFGI